MAATQQRTGPLRGSDGQIFDLAEASVAKKKSRVPEIALGVLLVAGCALAALAWQTIADPSRTVLAASSDVSRGEIITAEDLQAVQIASNDILNVVGSEQADAIIGRIAQVDLTSGTLLAPNMVADVVGVEPGLALVGITVSTGDLPSATLRAGSPVDVVVTPANNNDDSFLIEADTSVLIRNAVVAEIANGGDGVNLSLAVADADAAVLARAIAAERVRLVAVPEGRPEGFDTADEPEPDGTATEESTEDGEAAEDGQ